MNGEVLTIELTGKTDAIPLESFLEVISNTLGILQEIDANMSEATSATLDWRIVGASLNSPLLLTIAGLALLGVGDSGQVINAYLHGLDRIESGVVEVPPYFTENAVRKTQKLVGVLNGELRKVRFSGSDGIKATSVVPSVKSLDAVSVILEHHAQESLGDAVTTAPVIQLRAYASNYVEEKATLIGTLEMLSVHGKKPKFVIYDPLTQEDIDCFFAEERYEEVKAALPKNTSTPYRVEVTGKAKFNKKGHPVSIIVEQFRRLRDKSELPGFKDLEGINFTSGLDPTEYVRRLRNA